MGKKGILPWRRNEPGIKKPSPATTGCKYISLFLHVTVSLIYTFCVLCCFCFLSFLLVMLAKSLLSKLSGVVVKLLLMLFGIAWNSKKNFFCLLSRNIFWLTQLLKNHQFVLANLGLMPSFNWLVCFHFHKKNDSWCFFLALPTTAFIQHNIENLS